MSELPDGVERRQFDGESRLATRGEPVYGEPTDGEWRAWEARGPQHGAGVGTGKENRPGGGGGGVGSGGGAGAHGAPSPPLPRPDPPTRRA